MRPDTWWFQRDWTDTGRPLHQEIRLSYSRLSSLENCELQYVLSAELGLDTGSGPKAWIGHLIHSLIEECEEGRIERTRPERIVLFGWTRTMVRPASPPARRACARSARMPLRSSSRSAATSRS